MTMHRWNFHHVNADDYSHYALYDQALHVHRVNHTSDTLHHKIHVLEWVTLKDFPNQVGYSVVQKMLKIRGYEIDGTTR